MTRSIWDVITPRRLVITAFIALAVLVSIVGLQATRTPNQNDTCAVANTPIVQLSPCPGDEVLGQDKIGVDMQPGWLVDLTIDGTAVPKDQVQVQGSLFLFQPGPGTDVGDLRPGAHTAQITYYRSSADPATGQIFRWSFRSS